MSLVSVELPKGSSDEEEWSGKGICYDLDNTDECDAIIQEIDKRYGDNQGITYSIHSAKDDFGRSGGYSQHCNTGTHIAHIYVRGCIRDSHGS